MSRPPPPPLTLETAIQKVRLAEDAWNLASAQPERRYRWPTGRRPDGHGGLIEPGP